MQGPVHHETVCFRLNFGHLHSRLTGGQCRGQGESFKCGWALTMFGMHSFWPASATECNGSQGWKLLPSQEGYIAMSHSPVLCSFSHWRILFCWGLQTWGPGASWRSERLVLRAGPATSAGGETAKSKTNSHSLSNCGTQ